MKDAEDKKKEIIDRVIKSEQESLSDYVDKIKANCKVLSPYD